MLHSPDFHQYTIITAMSHIQKIFKILIAHIIKTCALKIRIESLWDISLLCFFIKNLLFKIRKRFLYEGLYFIHHLKHALVYCSSLKFSLFFFRLKHYAMLVKEKFYKPVLILCYLILITVDCLTNLCF
jgi:hypothetical protein